MTTLTTQDLLDYQDTMAAATRDIHAACPGHEISVLWDDGKLRMITGRHKVKVWNSLGSFEFAIDHDNLLRKDDAYKGLLALVAARVQKSLTV
jgi:hypothetical protein